MQTVTGLFDDYTDAQAAVRELETMGVPHSDISIVASNAKGDHDHLGAARANEAGEDAGKGAGIGATVGGLGGLLAGLGLLAIPGLGPVVAAGWLASTLVGAGVGAVVGGAAGGLVGALTHAGVSEDDANAYAEGVPPRRHARHRQGGRLARSLGQQPAHRRSRREPADPPPSLCHRGLVALRRHGPGLHVRADPGRAPALQPSLIPGHMTMKKTLLASALALSMGFGPMALGSAAFAQSPPVGGPDAKGNAPLKHMHTVNDGSAKPGANSFTEGQARQHIVNSGYSDVTGLTKGKDGVWRGMASHNGAQVNVAMDFKGNVTEASGGAGASAGAISSTTSQSTSAMPASGGQGGNGRGWCGRRRCGRGRDGDAPSSPHASPSPPSPWRPVRQPGSERRRLQRRGLHRQWRLRQGKERHAGGRPSLIGA